MNILSFGFGSEFLTNLDSEKNYIFTGVDVGIFVTSFRAPKARKSSTEGVRFLGGSGGMLPREILKSKVSEMPFPALWGNLIEGI